MATQEELEQQDMETLDEQPPFALTEMDKWLLSISDDEFTPHSWDNLKHIIETNTLEELLRKPSSLRRYLSWSRNIKTQYGSTTAYLIQHRLPWGPPPFTYTSPIPFRCPSDYKILLNDWPYGVEDDITHIVVWSKTPIATNEAGDVTEESRRVIEGFVGRVFAERVGKEKGSVIWFKNWAQLQSVRALEHIHVLVRNATGEDLEFWTGERVQIEET
ncbi:N-acetylglucosamine-induced protein 1 [Lachnellula arida]|uniref:N-acetylglucosamine-induced protein 1 n=1 Tax=Lachnellula arida TaxID=1316785 RepID=A0A8T9BQ58_9HELO|nr:N-acetylglucosamine-induced protein 1 [Lachnellula arida]